MRTGSSFIESYFIKQFYISIFYKGCRSKFFLDEQIFSNKNYGFFLVSMLLWIVYFTNSEYTGTIWNSWSKIEFNECERNQGWGQHLLMALLQCNQDISFFFDSFIAYDDRWKYEIDNREHYAHYFSSFYFTCTFSLAILLGFIFAILTSFANANYLCSRHVPALLKKKIG